MSLLVSLTSISDMISILGDEETIMKIFYEKHKIFLQNEHIFQSAFTRLEF